MDTPKHGYNGIILQVDLSTGKIAKKAVDPQDLADYLGGRGLGVKLLWDHLKDKPGTDPLGPDNPLLFMPGPVSGFPAPSASRTCVVTKSPITAPVNARYAHSATVSYANMGGFFGPELRFAGYDGLMITGQAAKPVYLYINDDTVEIRDAGKFWGMGTDAFDKAILEELADQRFRTCYIGPGGENRVRYACIMNTAARAAGRGGTGCVMGSKLLKAIAVKGSGQPNVAHHQLFLEALAESREKFKDPKIYGRWRKAGTAAAIEYLSGEGIQAVKNFREGTFTEVDKIGAQASFKTWVRSFACYCCPLACKKSGRTTDSPFAGLIHDGPEYETGTMLGANLMISDHAGMMKAIYIADDYGLDIISLGNVIGFLMEAYDKKLINQKILDGIDLKWGSVPATIEMIHRIAARKGIGAVAAKGVKALADAIGQDSHKFAMHVKGHELAAHNCHANPPRALCYATANRGACHLNGTDINQQNMIALADATGLCLFALRGYGVDGKLMTKLLTAIIGAVPNGNPLQIGERIYTLEKLFNYREGFTRADDVIPDRFFEEPLTVGKKKGAILTRAQFNTMMDDFYTQRGWEPITSAPTPEKLKQLGLPALT
ncbi:MAG: aldehyde ferredoxin oxidoreductase family protein [Desulfosarcinaceae bacterium]|nr:aldehyde ferredoxin oxidoreductase family protein [Desulfosarcinaceae bacterium]